MCSCCCRQCWWCWNCCCCEHMLPVRVWQPRCRRRAVEFSVWFGAEPRGQRPRKRAHQPSHPTLLYSDGQHLRTIGLECAGNGQFNGPNCIALDGAGHIWLWSRMAIVACKCCNDEHAPLPPPFPSSQHPLALVAAVLRRPSKIAECVSPAPPFAVCGARAAVHGDWRHR